MGLHKSAMSPTIVAKERTNSYSSEYSTDSIGPAASSTSRPTTGGIPRRNMNVYTHCGRHTNEFLFGGLSFTEMARSVFKRNER